MAITQDDVVRTAVRLLDEVGLEGLTLRRLGCELGVSAPTLYWHVRDKRALLDLVAGAIVAEHRPAVRPAHGQPWWEWLSDCSSAQYRALVSHRDAALVVAGNRPTEGALPAIEQVIGSLVEVGFPPREALDAILAIGHFVLGSALENHAAVRSGFAVEPDSTFQYGLALIMAGLRARHAELISAR